MIIKAFNECIGAMSDVTGASFEPEKGIRSYNIKATLFNVATLTLIYGVALTIFSNTWTGLVICSLSIAAKVFIHTAMKETFIGVLAQENNTFFIKKFITTRLSPLEFPINQLLIFL